MISPLAGDDGVEEWVLDEALDLRTIAATGAGAT